MQQYKSQNQSPAKGGKVNSDIDQDNQGSPYQNDQYTNYQDAEDSQEGDEVSKKLVGSRQSRKKAEEDVKLLQNRITLLKMEEKKAWKKIEDTKKKARDIMQVRQRNMEQQQMKEERQRQKEEEERMLQERNQQLKTQTKDQIQQSKMLHEQKLKEEADRLKQEKREQQEFLNMQKQQEQMKNASIKQMIRNQELELQQKKKQDEAEKKSKVRQELIQKILQENQRRMEIEAEVERMEQEELELIQRLQNTQIMQKAAYDDLEGALNNQFSPDQLSTMNTTKKGVSPAKSFGSSGQKFGGRPQTAGQHSQNKTPSSLRK